MNNAAEYGGAVAMPHGMITVGTESYVIFTYNHAAFGGALLLNNAILIIDSVANLIFSHNSAHSNGGALSLENSIVHVNTSGITIEHHLEEQYILCMEP